MLRSPFLPGLTALALLSCGPSIKRDLGSVRQSAITYDDMCHLQSYFTQRATAHAPPFRAENETSTETTREERDERGQLRPVTVGEGTYVLEQRTDRVRFRRMLRDEYSRLPDMGITAPEARVAVRVNWWQAGGLRRVRNDGLVTITVGEQTWQLPPHPCVGEFLFGEPGYVMRQCFLESEHARAAGQIPGACSLEDVLHPDAAVASTDVAVTDAPTVDAPTVDAPVGDASTNDAAPMDAATDTPGDAPAAEATAPDAPIDAGRDGGRVPPRRR